MKEFKVLRNIVSTEYGFVFSNVVSCNNFNDVLRTMNSLEPIAGYVNRLIREPIKLKIESK